MDHLTEEETKKHTPHTYCYDRGKGLNNIPTLNELLSHIVRDTSVCSRSYGYHGQLPSDSDQYSYQTNLGKKNLFFRFHVSTPLPSNESSTGGLLSTILKYVERHWVSSYRVGDVIPINPDLLRNNTLVEKKSLRCRRETETIGVTLSSY